MLKRILYTFAFLFPLLVLADGGVPITFTLKDDGREWVKIRDDSLEGQGLVEFMLSYEDKAHWTEIVRIQYFASEDLDPKQLYNSFLRDVKSQIGKGKLTSKMIKEQNKDIMADWTISGTENDQYEIIRIMSNGKFVVILRYTTKKGRVDEKNIQTWKSIIENAKFSSESEILQ